METPREPRFYPNNEAFLLDVSSSKRKNVEVRRVLGKIDEVIQRISDAIVLCADNEMYDYAASMTKALAELINARAYAEHTIQLKED